MKHIGPGFAVAATGIGAGDVVAAAVVGAQFGPAVLWAALLGALLKFALNEGIARWQLATGQTLIAGWGMRLHRAVSLGFLAYLVLWSFVVAGALMAACGLAAHALVPAVPVSGWGLCHSGIALLLVSLGRYTFFERLMKVFIALMFAATLVSAALVGPGGFSWSNLLVPTLPEGAGPLLLGVVGGVGGSVTLLSYGYWIRARGWTTRTMLPRARLDLGLAYGLTGLFGAAIIVLAAQVDVATVTGNRMALALAEEIGHQAGPFARWIFLIGFWGAVFTSMLGVWQGVPYLFADVWRSLHGRATDPEPVDERSRLYRGYLWFLAVPPAVLLFADRPVWIIVIYSIAGAFFMPFLAGVLLYLNNRRAWVGQEKNGKVINVMLGSVFLLFLVLLIQEII